MKVLVPVGLVIVFLIGFVIWTFSVPVSERGHKMIPYEIEAYTINGDTLTLKGEHVDGKYALVLRDGCILVKNKELYMVAIACHITHYKSN